MENGRILGQKLGKYKPFVDTSPATNPTHNIPNASDDPITTIN
jgi:hypothetical protein